MAAEGMNGYIDIHTHILPGVDDGAANMEQALSLVRMAYENGTRTLFLTPHYRGTYIKNDPDYLQEVFSLLCQSVWHEFPAMNLFLGNEVLYEAEAPEKLAAGQILTLHRSKYCLLEFRNSVLRSQVITGVSEIIRYGYTPVIAHVERYDIFQRETALVYEVLEMGALIQLNAMSVLGENGWSIKRFCNQMLKNHLVHFIASDAHDMAARPPLLRECWRRILKKYGIEYANQLFYYNAQAIIENKSID